MSSTQRLDIIKLNLSELGFTPSSEPHRLDLSSQLTPERGFVRAGRAKDEAAGAPPFISRLLDKMSDRRARPLSSQSGGRGGLLEAAHDPTNVGDWPRAELSPTMASLRTRERERASRQGTKVEGRATD